MLNRINATPEIEAVQSSGADCVHVLHRDYETRSEAILKTVGIYRYATDPSTTVLCAGYAVDDEPVQLWTPGDPVPAEFLLAAQNENWIVAAHNDAFETIIEKQILSPQYRWPVIPIERHRCTQAICLAHGLPARLSAAADALELSNRKDAAGERLMHQTSKPRKARKDEDTDRVHWFDDDDRLQRLYEYCKQDVEVERELFNRLPQLPLAEQQLWQLNYQINVRGFYIDRAFAEAARKIAEAAAPEIDQEIAELTSGAISSINQVAKLQTWMLEQGCSIESLDRKAIEKLLLAELPPKVQRVLELRLGGAQAAVKKIDALLRRAGGDDRVRGAFRYPGAGTGRWAGEGVQPHNLKRPVIDDLDTAVAAVSTGDYQHVRSLYPRPLSG